MGNKLNRAIYLIGSTLVRPFFGTKVVGKENIPADGCLICPNHTTASDAISSRAKYCIIMRTHKLIVSALLSPQYWLCLIVGARMAAILCILPSGNELCATSLTYHSFCVSHIKSPLF